MKLCNTIVTLAFLSLIAACGFPSTEPPKENPSVTPPDQAGPTAQASGNALAGTQWMLEHYGPSDRPNTPLTNTSITATFRDDGTLEGSSGCNNYFANYIVEGQRLRIDQPGRTERGCAEQIMRQENQFLEALIAVDSFTLQDDTLTISYKNGALRFKALQPTAAAPLLDTPWQLTTFVQDGTAQSLVAGTQITMRLANGVARGTAGCNRYSGQYTADGTQLTISQVVQTKMACTGAGVMEQEARYVAALEAATAWKVEGSTLVISHAGGELHFTAMPVTPDETTTTN